MSTSPTPAQPPARVTVHTSWRGLVTAVLSPLLLIGFGVLVTLAGGGPVAVLLLGLGLVLAGITLLDYPRRVEFTTEGIERVGFLRTQRLPWSDIVAIERTPPTARSALRRRPAGASGAGDAPLPGTEDRDVAGGRVSGGLVARGLGRRRYLLTDRVEGRLEFDALARLLRDLDVATNLRAGRPGPDTPPSDLYRRGAARRQDRT